MPFDLCNLAARLKAYETIVSCHLTAHDSFVTIKRKNYSNENYV